MTRSLSRVIRPLVPLFLFCLVVAGCGERPPVVIGAIVSETGAAASYGPEIRRGMEIAVDEVNERGGVMGGRKLVFEFRDDGSDPHKALELARELVEKDQVRALIGAVSSTVALKLAPYANGKDIVLLSPSASSNKLTYEGGDYFFRIYPSDQLEGQAMADLVRKLGFTEAAVLAQDDSFGQDMAEVFTGQFESPNEKVVLRESFPQNLTAKAANELAKKVKESKAGAVFMAAYEPNVALLLDAFQEEGVEAVRVATSAVKPQIVDMAGAAAERLAFPQPPFDLTSGDDRVQAFLRAYMKKYNTTASDVFAAFGYDAAKVLAEAINRTRIAAPGEIHDRLREINYEGVTGNIDFDNRGDVAKMPIISVIKDGKVMRFEKFNPALMSLLLP